MASADQDRFRLLITGSRTWADAQAIADALRPIYRQYGQNVTLVSGGAAGADTLCEELARKAGWTVERHPADWEQYGRAAGHRRNAQMVARGADLCLAFIRDNSKGASSCADMAEKAGIPVTRFQPTPA